ncbi:GIY-YIG nuclease family protein [Acidithiobacillus montserratensis]|uniref:GIY-YIG nuclease family protein n=1 Tax=Acidithiobacillus montserratensis TaxID=2729135 RepID=A0ACD5HD69_9PROT|nr:GIY-YIG nuclease family protein [Acidithiobacillus montserratensis]MBU2748251.1 GIY-YIG nuclease family protein [Acidithiobacillus montserratensis]
MAGVIYLMTNVAMPGMVKIGKTESAETLGTRLKDLNNTSVPLPFECYFAAEVEDADALESKLHKLFGEYRVNPKREFFNLDPEKAVIAISIGSYKEISIGASEAELEDQEALEQEKQRRSRINLSALGINPGDELTFSRSDSFSGVVVEGNKSNHPPAKPGAFICEPLKAA